MNKELSDEQIEYFKNSMFRDKDGNLLKAYHGSGTTIEAFDPSFTSNGSDQYGSGFYFTTSRRQAEMYTTSRNTDMSGKEVPKLGGEDKPTVVEVYLNIENPIICNGFEHVDLSEVLIPNSKVYDIVKRLPTLYHLVSDEEEPNPLGDYLDEFWDVNPQTKEEFEPLIKEMVERHFQNTDLKTLDIFFGKNGTVLRKAIHEELGYDGVIVKFERKVFHQKSEMHGIAWFPEQIKDVRNLCPQHTKKLMDKIDTLEKENSMELKDLLKNANTIGVDVEIGKDFVWFITKEPNGTMQQFVPKSCDDSKTFLKEMDNFFKVKTPDMNDPNSLRHYAKMVELKNHLDECYKRGIKSVEQERDNLKEREKEIIWGSELEGADDYAKDLEIAQETSRDIDEADIPNNTPEERKSVKNEIKKAMGIKENSKMEKKVFKVVEKDIEK